MLDETDASVMLAAKVEDFRQASVAAFEVVFGRAVSHMPESSCCGAPDPAATNTVLPAEESA